MVIIDEKDIGKPREVLLMDLVQETTGYRIPYDKIHFGKPREVDQRTDLKFDPNTFIPARVDVSYDARYSVDGSGFMYRRRPIAQHVDECDDFKVIPAVLPFDVYSVLDQINACLPYPIDQSDVINVKYTDISQLQNGLLLRAHPESLFWCGSAPLPVDPKLLTGGTLITNLVLDGFHVYVPPSVPVA